MHLSITGTYHDQFLPPNRVWSVALPSYMNALKIHPGLPRAGRLQTARTHRGVHGDSVNEALIRLWKITLICCDSMIVIYMVYIKTHVFSLILYYNCKYFNPKWVFHYVIYKLYYLAFNYLEIWC